MTVAEAVGILRQSMQQTADTINQQSAMINALCAILVAKNVATPDEIKSAIDQARAEMNPATSLQESTIRPTSSDLSQETGSRTASSV